ncbi:MAG TPA: PKD domain-containing protein [Patescibacteria group bacterium]|nr:PKD domain-containing protein [Patescibacteria group bacterium]
MSLFSGKKLLLAGFIVVLLIGVPLTVYLLQQQQETRTQAQKSTNLTFAPPTTSSSPLKVKVGEQFTFDVMVNPGSNLVSYVRLDIRYDATKLEAVGPTTYAAESSAQFPIIEGPVFQSGRIIVTQSVGGNPTNAIQQQATKIGTLTLKAKEATAGIPVQIQFNQETEVLSLGEGDSGSEDVLASTQPAFITVEGSSTTTPTTSPSPSRTVTSAPTKAVTPTVKPTTGATTPTSAPTPTTGGGGGTGSSNIPPNCTALNVDRTTSGTAPFNIVFTAVGNDTDGTINKVAFNFGDGPVENMTETGGIGSNSVSPQKSHTYQNPGTYTASAVLTDNLGAVSETGACTQTVTVLSASTAGGGTTGAGTGGTGGGSTTQPTVEAPGPGNVFFGIGALLGVISLIGGLLFFAL